MDRNIYLPPCPVSIIKEYNSKERPVFLLRRPRPDQLHHQVGGVPILQRYCTENSKHMFPEKELRGHSPNSYIHISVCGLYITTIGPPILLQENRWTDRSNI